MLVPLSRDCSGRTTVKLASALSVRYLFTNSLRSSGLGTAREPETTNTVAASI